MKKKLLVISALVVLVAIVAVVSATLLTSHTQQSQERSSAYNEGAERAKLALDLPPRNWSGKMCYNGPKKGVLAWQERGARQKRSSGS